MNSTTVNRCLKNESSPAIRLFEFHGLVGSHRNGEWLTDCPFCDKDDHLYVNAESGLWKCHRCDESGNQATFLNKLLDRSLKGTTGGDYECLSDLKGLPAETLRKYELAISSVSDNWLLPSRDKNGRLLNIHRYDQRSNKLLGSPGHKQVLYGLDRLRPQGPIWIAEGHWDAMALDFILAEEETSVMAVPGANIFQESWFQYLAGRPVALLFDNDQPGGNGMNRIVQICNDSPIKPTTLEVLGWPEGKPLGYDVRDLLQGVPRKQALAFLRSHLREQAVCNVSTVERFTMAVPQSIEWLWQDRIPLHAVTTVFGPGGIGKSFLHLYLMAQVSRGRPFFDGAPCKRGSALLLNLEDPFGELRKRLDTFDADVNRIFYHNFEKDDQGPLQLNSEMSRLEDMIINQTSDDLRLLVFDPVEAFMGGKNGNVSEDVRSIYTPLTALARKYDLAVVAIRHSNKKEDTSGRARCLGSSAFIDCARQALEVRKRRSVVYVNSVKANYVGRIDPLAFKIQDTESGPTLVWVDADGIGTEPTEEALKLSFLRQVIRRYPEGETLTVLRKEAKMNPSVFKQCVEQLADQKVVERCRVMKNGRRYDGFKPVSTKEVTA